MAKSKKKPRKKKPKPRKKKTKPRSKPKTKSKIKTRDLHQTGKRKSLKADIGRKAKLPGTRRAKSGKTYSERRRNRSDVSRKAGWI